jgi:glutaconate CoA-transferase subunit B
VFIIMAQSRRSFVDRLDFVTSLGHGEGRGSRERLGVTTKGPTRVITDLCVMEPDEANRQLEVVAIHPGVSRQQIADSTGWPVKFAARVADTPPPTAEELRVLRDLHARTRAAFAPAQ